MGERPSIWAETPEQRQKRVRHHEVIDMCLDMYRELQQALNGLDPDSCNKWLDIEVCWSQGGSSKDQLFGALDTVEEREYPRLQIEQLKGLLHELWPNAAPYPPVSKVTYISP